MDCYWSDLVEVLFMTKNRILVLNYDNGKLLFVFWLDQNYSYFM